jgi:hypothetical protein
MNGGIELEGSNLADKDVFCKNFNFSRILCGEKLSGWGSHVRSDSLGQIGALTDKCGSLPQPRKGLGGLAPKIFGRLGALSYPIIPKLPPKITL